MTLIVSAKGLKPFELSRKEKDAELVMVICCSVNFPVYLAAHT